MISKFYRTFNVAGFSYYDGLDVVNEMQVGSKLRIEAEPNNPYDPNAVVIFFEDTKIGYVPRGENKEISKFLQLGHTDLFQVFINRKNLEEHPEEQIGVVVKITDKTSSAK